MPGYSKHLRPLFEKQNGWCHYCGTRMEIKEGKFKKIDYKGIWATVDHIIPQVAGGTGELSNLIASCASCNSSKHHMPYDDFIYLLDCDDVTFNKFLQKNMHVREQREKDRRRKKGAKRERNMLRWFVMLWKHFPELAHAILTEASKHERAGLRGQKKNLWEIKIKNIRKRRQDNGYTKPTEFKGVPDFCIYSSFE